MENGKTGYLDYNQAVSKLYSEYTTSHFSPIAQKSRNATREGDIIGIGSAIEKLTHAQNPAKLPSTNNKEVSVEENPLVSFLAEPYPGYSLKDPLFPKYHYTYKNDGIHYTVSTILTNNSDENKITGSYLWVDGALQTK